MHTPTKTKGYPCDGSKCVGAMCIGGDFEATTAALSVYLYLPPHACRLTEAVRNCQYISPFECSSMQNHAHTSKRVQLQQSTTYQEVKHSEEPKSALPFCFWGPAGRGRWSCISAFTRRGGAPYAQCRSGYCCTGVHAA